VWGLQLLAAASLLQSRCPCLDSRVEIEPCPVCLGDAQDPVCLPCDHVFCLSCIKVWLTLGQMRCPFCLTDLPEDYSLTVSQEHREAIKKHACVRQLCNSFFLDLVSTVCFKDNSPPQKEVIDVLLNLLFVQKELLRDTSQSKLLTSCGPKNPVPCLTSSWLMGK